MRKKLFILIFIFFVLFTIILFYNSWKHTYNSDNKESIVSTLTYGDDGSAVLDYSSLESGLIFDLPWINKADYLAAVADNNAFLLMAAYRTVLPDPLPGEEFNVHLAAKMLAGTVIKPQQIFSHNDHLGPYIENRGFKVGPTYIGSQMTTTIGGGVCKIASTLYNVVIFSNLEVIERHPHSMPVPYVPYGQDATVAYGTKDFKFRNNTSTPLLIWAEGVGNDLYIAIYGQTKPPKVKWQHEVVKLVKKSVIYRENSNLPIGEEQVIMSGMDGGIIKSGITIEKDDGSLETKNLGRYYYAPFSDIIERGI